MYKAMSIFKLPKKNKLMKGYWKNPIHLISCGFGTGASPYAPGTVGTVLGVAIYLPMSYLPLPEYLLVTLAAFLLGVYVCGVTGKALGEHDHSGIVWDEVVGYMITMTAIPFDWLWMLVGFIVFRIFDVIKPWPIRVIDKKIKGGFGVMFDDVLAGIFAWVVMFFLVLYMQ